MARLLTSPAKQPPALNGLHRLLISVCDYVWGGLETFPLQADVENVVTVCAEVGSENVSIELYWDVAHSHSDSPFSFVF